MAICQFFLRGNCRFGAGCKNEHPQNGGRPTFGNQTWTPSGTGNTTAGSNSKPSCLSFTQESIKKDLTENDDRPLWPLSSYGPGKSEPTLISGIDESPEELRFMAWQAMKSGDMTQVEAYKTYETNKISAAQQAFQHGRDNSLDAFRAAYQASPHVSKAPTQPTSAFSDQSRTTSAFGTVTKPTSVFGQPAFGQTSQPRSAFGQPAFGQTAAPVSAFGTSTSTFGQSNQTMSAFGQPSQPTSAFGTVTQPTSAFGSVIKPPSGFGQSAFGQPVKPASAFGQPAFGQPTKPASAFGQPAFGQPAFGQTSQPSAFSSATPSSGGGFSAFTGKPVPFAPLGAASSAFGGTAAAPQSAFGNPTTTLQSTTFGTGGTGTAFGTTTSTLQPAFGTSNTTPAFGAPMATDTSAFGLGTGSVFGPNALGLAAFPPSAPPAPSAFGVPNQSLAAAEPTQIQTETPSAAQPQMQMQPSSNQQSNIASFSFHASQDPYAALLPADYLNTIPKAVKDAFASQEFKWGNVPEWIPPIEMR